MVTPFITDMGETIKMTDQNTGDVIEIGRFAYWTDMGRRKPEVKEVSNDLNYLRTKYKVPDNRVVNMKKFKNKLNETMNKTPTSNKLIIDIESPTGEEFRILFVAKYPSKISFSDVVRNYLKKSRTGGLVQLVDMKTGETVKGPKFDTTQLKINKVVDLTQKAKTTFTDNVQSVLGNVKQQEPYEPMHVEPRDRYQENSHMNEINKFKNIVKECIIEIKQENDPKHRLKESLRGVVRGVLKEMATTTNLPKPDEEEKTKIQKGYNKKGNERLDKTNDKQSDELDKIVKSIDPTWEAYWDDHQQLIVVAQNLLYVRVCPQYENNFNVDVMVKLIDRVRAIGLTWEQVKSFVKENFGNLKNETKADGLRQKALDHYKDNEVIKKDAGPEKAKVAVRYQDPKNPSVKDTKRSDKNYNEPQTKRDEDMPDQPMKQVTDPGKDPESKNKNIEKTDKVKPPKHKNDKKLKVSDKKTPKFTKKSTE